MQWICSQIGAREHYAIPRVLHRQGKLDSLYTDLWASPAWRAAGDLIGRPVLATRYHDDLATARVKNFNLSTLVDRAFGGGSSGNPYDWFLRVGSDFSRSVEAMLERRKGVNWTEMIFFGYDTGFLEAARWVKRRGGKSVVCQMDPSRFEVDLVKEEERLWPGWAKRSIEIPEAYFRRRDEEWALAELVMVNSEWCRKALIQQGVRDDKIIVVPLAYEVEASRVESREPSRWEATRKTTEGSPEGSTVFREENDVKRGTRGEGSAHTGTTTRLSTFDSSRPLRVLFLGQVILRKGIQYLMEAARSLQNEPIHFDVVGPIGLSEAAVQSAPGNMTFHGAISRDKAPKFFMNADLFVLPTLSDGFAITQIEAMSYGLPVITTPNCGAVVSDGVDGLILAARDATGLTAAIRSFLDEPERLSGMREAAKFKAAQFGFEHLARNLTLIEERLVQHSC
jgi:glycosyltransferase involved in cell wall biosynthesis